MPRYFFDIRQDGYSSDHAEGLEFPDKEAARTEAAAVCADMMCGIVGQAANRPEWRLDVTDEAGKLLFRFKFGVGCYAQYRGPQRAGARDDRGGAAETGAKVPLSASDGAAALQRGFLKILCDGAHPSSNGSDCRPERS